MKIEIEIECSPEEARRFLGLPDLAPLQAAALNTLQDQMRDAIQKSDPEALLSQWMPVGLKNWESLQRQFFDAMVRQGKPEDEAIRSKKNETK